MGLSRRPLWLAGLLLTTLLATLLALVPGVAAQGVDGPTSLTPPTVTGPPVFARRLTADPGTWDPADVELAYRWLRDGVPVDDATGSTYLLGLDDLRHRLSVEVTATSTDASGHSVTAVALSEPTSVVRRAPMLNRRLPAVRGEARYPRTLRATPGRWRTDPTIVRYRWQRDGEPIAGPRRAQHVITPEDVGHRLSVQVAVKAPGHAWASATSEPVGPVAHRVGVRRTVTYHVETRGRIVTSVGEFARLAQETYDDARGWRGAGVRFVRVARGGDFTLVLAAESTVPSFSSGCSSTYSCRVGRYVIINQDRWRLATPPWREARGSLRDYRHMVLNHETGHWLGLGHATCGGPGRPAPVMQQQSKGLGGCRFNPWPTASEQGRV
ncbi:MAG: DUF3152 domain-containing protein [Actinobacteria bacterium]|uniref:Unannotated protein n=1 Tax=freshwater metagenome TaxID=449393 RepID=A0A6J6SB70_9ZZZZ|nr:DUF3152 domain-containing protein [Actinomycetota bacterium]